MTVLKNLEKHFKKLYFEVENSQHIVIFVDFVVPFVSFRGSALRGTWVSRQTPQTVVEATCCLCVLSRGVLPVRVVHYWSSRALRWEQGQFGTEPYTSQMHFRRGYTHF